MLIGAIRAIDTDGGLLVEPFNGSRWKVVDTDYLCFEHALPRDPEIEDTIVAAYMPHEHPRPLTWPWHVSLMRRAAL